MQLPLNARIAGEKKVEDWLAVRPNLNNLADNVTWERVFEDYFLARLNERYLNPIFSIKHDGKYSGEGFSIMVILCSLIEFLETTYKGINYRFVRKGDPALGLHEYDKSSPVFIDFLTLRPPFSSEFDLQLALSFYTNIRCGLLHEARTNGNWRIHGMSTDGALIKIGGIETILFRDDFFEAVQIYINQNYKNDLLNSVDRKEAFLRKFDRLCIE